MFSGSDSRYIKVQNESGAVYVTNSNFEEAELSFEVFDAGWAQQDLAVSPVIPLFANTGVGVMTNEHDVGILMIHCLLKARKNCMQDPSSHSDSGAMIAP